MTYPRDRGWVRRKKPTRRCVNDRWCGFRPHEEHQLFDRDRESHLGDIWVCPECKTVWVAVLRPSLFESWVPIPHPALKWKRMCEWRAKRWRQKWEAQQ